MKEELYIYKTLKFRKTWNSYNRMSNKMIPAFHGVLPEASTLIKKIKKIKELKVPMYSKQK